MKTITIRICILSLAVLLIAASCTQEQEQETATTSASSSFLTSDERQPKRPANFEPFQYEYSIAELYKEFSEDMMQRAAADVQALTEVNDEGTYDPSLSSLGEHPVPEWFEDAKLGFFLDWGPWSVPGYAPLEGAEASTGGSYPDWYEFLMDHLYKDYHDEVWGADFRRDDFLPLLTGENFDAEEYMDLASESGFKYFVPFTRHHGGWAMWDSEYTKRNAMEMGPKRDIYGELTEAAREHNMKLGLYFSVSEWEYPVIVDNPLSQWDPIDHLAVFQDQLGQIPRATPLASFFPSEMDGKISGKIPVRDYFADYMIPLFKEAVDNYDPDLLWYDGGWGSPVSVSRTMETSAYFYNQAEGRKKVVINNRAGSTLKDEDLAKVREYMRTGQQEKAMEIYLSGQQLGDYGTPEFTIGEVDISKKWEVCRSISPAFGYNWQDNEENSLSSEELVKMFVDIVAHNGNLLLVVSPDGTGRLPDIQKGRIVDLGDWLKVNGEGIYGTRPWRVQQEGDQFFTQSKDDSHVYVHCTAWPGETLRVSDLTPKSGAVVKMLGDDNELEWSNEGNTLEIILPAALQEEDNRPGKHVWVIKVPV
jgi:alpha-L-fucosidase